MDGFTYNATKDIYRIRIVNKVICILKEIKPHLEHKQRISDSEPLA